MHVASYSHKGVCGGVCTYASGSLCVIINWASWWRWPRICSFSRCYASKTERQLSSCLFISSFLLSFLSLSHSSITLQILRSKLALQKREKMPQSQDFLKFYSLYYNCISLASQGRIVWSSCFLSDLALMGDQYSGKHQPFSLGMRTCWKYTEIGDGLQS